MKQEILVKRLQQRKPVYIYDDYEEAVVRITPMEDIQNTKVFIKYKDCCEVETMSTDETVSEIILRGIRIYEEEYLKY